MSQRSVAAPLVGASSMPFEPAYSPTSLFPTTVIWSTNFPAPVTSAQMHRAPTPTRIALPVMTVWTCSSAPVNRTVATRAASMTFPWMSMEVVPRLSTWIYRVLVNSCYAMLRRRRRRPVEVAAAGESRETAGFAVPASDHPLRLSLEACVRDLDPQRRAAFVLFEVEGFTHREVGDILGVPEGTSRTLLFEARRELQRLLSRRGIVAGARR